MKEIILTVISMTIGFSLLTTVVVNDKFKGHIRVVSVLVITVTVVNLLNCKGYKNETLANIQNFTTSNTPSFSMYNEIVATIVEEIISSEFNVRYVEVDCNVIYGDNIDIEYIKIFTDTADSLIEIMNTIEEYFGAVGKVSVYKKSAKGT